MNNLLSLLGNKGLECSILVRTDEEALYYTNIFNLKKSYSCFFASQFITYLFLNIELEDNLLNDLSNNNKFNEFDKCFSNMKMSWFHIGHENGSHECNLIYISSNEIYLIDYYSETNRKKTFRVIKFKTEELSKNILNEALFNNNSDMYNILFGFKNKEKIINISASFHIFDINKIPDFSDLNNLFEKSLILFENDFDNNKKRCKKIIFLDFKNTFDNDIKKIKTYHDNLKDKITFTSSNEYYDII